VKIGHDFGRTPFGLASVAAAFKRRCICDARYLPEIAHVSCRVHGLEATLRAVVKRDRQEAAA
jgi:hypothetical protein